MDTSLISSLICINTCLGQCKAAKGILKFVQQHQNTQLDEGWYEKLGRCQALGSFLNTTERKQSWTSFGNDEPGGLV